MTKKKAGSKKLTVTKRPKSTEDIHYPIPQDFNPIRADRPPNNKEVVKRIIQGTVRLAYSLKPPAQWDYHGNYVKPKAVATPEQIEMVTHLIEALQPEDAIEAALASQFAVTYIRAMESHNDYSGDALLKLDLFEFGHKVLEALQKYRSRGAQQINVRYINRGQVVNIKTENGEQSQTMDIGGR